MLAKAVALWFWPLLAAIIYLISGPDPSLASYLVELGSHLRLEFLVILMTNVESGLELSQLNSSPQV